MKRFLCVMLSLMMVAGMMSIASADAAYTPGTYTASAAGKMGDVTVEVTVSDNAIESVVVTAHSETPGIADPAIDAIPAAIVNGQTLAVDTVSGASVTSAAILTAAEAALAEAGADIEALKVAVATAETAAAPVEDMHTDVLVVGAGLAGLSAAVSAREAGAEVIVVEKMAATGGTSALSGGGIAAPGSHLQVEAGIVDSPAAYVNEWMMYQNQIRSGKGELDVDRMMFLANSGAELIEWLEGYGYEFGAPTSFGMIEGVDRFHYPSNMATTQAGKMTEVAESVGAQILLNTRATELVVEDGKVIGAVMEQNGQTFTIFANAVVLASGGYSQSEELTARLCPENLGALHVSSVGGTGDGIVMAEAIGAALYENQWMMGMSYSVSQDGNTLNNLGGPWTISMMVDNTGARFMNENCHPNAYTRMVVRAAYPYYVIQDSADPAKAAILQENEGCEYLIKGDTLEELAANAGFNTDIFTGWVYNWNNGIKNGSDAFGSRISYMAPLTEGPFYAVKMTPVNMDSFGGIKTDLEARVLREDGSAIENLYAAGAISNGAIYDLSYMSGSAVLNCYTMGRIAGANAAK